ncbi:hypothetical protein AC579_922 [Pseudocercospora musae]|uniref:Uncharacterized protein n=1 Tax=Pseudocercospora musae TaxID=113226 RepID=A0A139HC95_9PEZI|nr:hypothetical protein AC579_922 [Pseudocercospora musae]
MFHQKLRGCKNSSTGRNCFVPVEAQQGTVSKRRYTRPVHCHHQRKTEHCPALDATRLAANTHQWRCIVAPSTSSKGVTECLTVLVQRRRALVPKFSDGSRQNEPQQAPRCLMSLVLNGLQHLRNA